MNLRTDGEKEVINPCKKLRGSLTHLLDMELSWLLSNDTCGAFMFHTNNIPVPKYH